MRDAGILPGKHRKERQFPDRFSMKIKKDRSFIYHLAIFVASLIDSSREKRFGTFWTAGGGAKGTEGGREGGINATASACRARSRVESVASSRIREKRKRGKAGWRREATGGATEMAEERRTHRIARRVPLATETSKERRSAGI